MEDVYGPLHKSRKSLAFFAIPACAIFGGAFALVLQDSGSIAAAFTSLTVLISTAIALSILIWGFVFVSKPIATLTQEALILPDGQSLDWAVIADAVQGQTTATVASANTGPRNVVHEVVRLHHKSGEQTKIVTTWAAIGPQAANDRILAAFARR